MNTFLPYADYQESAKSLDMKRLGKQRVETLQILQSLAGLSKGWRNHPATKMWENHEQELIKYGIAICDEWISRGYKDTCRQKIADLSDYFGDTTIPNWLGDEEVHLSHQSNLIRKDPVFYIPLFGDIDDNLPYVWRV